MAKINIVFADTDELYLNNLTNYFIEKEKAFISAAFTSKESLDKYLSDERNAVDILVITEAFLSPMAKGRAIPVRVLLAEGPDDAADDFLSVSKYQKVSNLIAEIKIRYAEKTGRVSDIRNANRNAKTVAFYSPVGGAGKTTLALSFGIVLSNFEKKSAYLNLERIDSTAGLLEAHPKGNFSEIMLAAKTKGGNIGAKILTEVRQNASSKLYYANPPDSMMEYNEMTSSELGLIVSEFANAAEFDVLILDMCSSFNRANLDIMEYCDFVFLPFVADAISINKMRLFMNEFNIHHELESLSKKGKLLLNKVQARGMQIVLESGVIKEHEIITSFPFTSSLSSIRDLPYSASKFEREFRPLVDLVTV